MALESTGRSIAKSISWRVLASTATVLLVYAFTGEIKIAVSIGLLEVVVKMVLYFFHERAWNRVSFGRLASEKAETAAAQAPSAAPSPVRPPIPVRT